MHLADSGVLVMVAVAPALSCGGSSAPARAPDAEPAAPAVAVAAVPASCEFGDFARCSATCSGSDPESCNNLGAMYEVGQGAPLDRDRARALYSVACAGGALAACGNMKRMGDTTVATAAPSAAPPSPATAPSSSSSAWTTWSSSNSTTVVVASESCTVDGRAVECAPGRIRISTSPGGRRISIVVGGVQIYVGRSGRPTP